MNKAIAAEDIVAAPALREAVRVWAWIGCLSFGGPAGQIALMHKTIVDEKRWISEERFLHALNFCMLLPGPEAQQLATYIGWLMHGVRGGLIAGLLFILPGFLLILILSSLYAVFQEAAWLPALFFGVKAAVLAIVIEALLRVSRRALKERFHYYVAGASFLALFMLNLPFPLIIVLAGAAGLLWMKYRQRGLATPMPQTARRGRLPAVTPHAIARPLVVLVFWILVWQSPLFFIRGLDAPMDLIAETLSGETNVFGAVFIFFSKMAVITFGGAYAVLSYVAQVAVGHYAWLQPGEMLDGLALAETTPGPLVLVLCFVGFLAGYRNPIAMAPLAGGVLGAFLAAWATFVPSFIWIFAGAPYIEKLRNNEKLSAALSAITAAVVGVILNLALWFGLHVLFAEVGRVALFSGKTGLPIISVAWPQWGTLDAAALVIFLLASVLLFRFKKGILTVIGISTAAGLLAKAAAAVL
ncbi:MULTISPECIES: chromate efflux transporter [unclassified Rhizobium]|uniref:chromate efflux transporter n=1 Tax=unclassified Rhizobium TaxID=2613769 RepID=UPI00161EF635|nr:MULTISPECIES: chromate efflux transporter [unclassified Rhizobium]MBB3540092.1 chromate transporter [Rhizobium sp. BK399]MCS3738898.1 chromate transporter [Rhizobium sp. BK661]MCS4090777.1 chromate transporter [Rhizobium sp. BK176]